MSCHRPTLSSTNTTQLSLRSARTVQRISRCDTQCPALFISHTLLTLLLLLSAHRSHFPSPLLSFFLDSLTPSHLLLSSLSFPWRCCHRPLVYPFSSLHVSPSRTSSSSYSRPILTILTILTPIRSSIPLHLAFLLPSLVSQSSTGRSRVLLYNQHHSKRVCFAILVAD
jgi:hypothetical protein